MLLLLFYLWLCLTLTNYQAGFTPDTVLDQLDSCPKHFNENVALPFKANVLRQIIEA